MGRPSSLTQNELPANPVVRYVYDVIICVTYTAISGFRVALFYYQFFAVYDIYTL